MKNYIRKIIVILIVLVMILPVTLPVVSRAVSTETPSNEEDITLSVQLQRDETNSNLVHITAIDTAYNITDLKYTHQYINTDNIDYFEQNNDDVYTFDITPAQTIEETFELDGYGSYTVYARNSRGDRFLARLTVSDPSDMPQITLTKDEENPLILTIQVTSSNNTITALKIAKKEDINDNIDFSTQGTDIEFIESNDVTVRYTDITEEGLYVVYAEDSQGNRATRQIYVAEQNTPITVEITEGSNPREVNLQISDTICDIVSVKVARSSEISNFDDFATIEGLPITQGQNVNVTYTAPEDDTYVLYIEDEAGYRIMTQRRITTEESSMQVSIAQDENAPGNLTITATNNICNIVEMKVAIGEDINIDYFENNGEEISIEPGREVVGTYTVDENCTMNVYVRDEQGYSYMYSRTLIGIDQPEPTPNEPPTITLTQNEQNPRQIDVTVRDEDSSVDQVKWAEGNQTTAYFATNGTRIGQGIIGNVIRTEFTIDAIGTYTVYAVDEEGNETVQTIEITSIEETPEPSEDVIPPQIDNVEDNGIYGSSVTPTITDEHLAEIHLTRNGLDVEGYTNGDTIEEEGNYVLNAVDEAGNETVVRFIIDKTAPEITINQENTDNKNVEVSIGILDNLTEVASVKAAQGEQTIEYFENGGQELTIEKENNTANAAINVTQNGIYTIYVQDEAGNASIETFEVTTITEEPEIDDTTPPTIETTNESINDNESIRVTINVSDTESQITEVKIANGMQDIDYFENEGTSLTIRTDDKTAEAAVMITQNGIYTIYAEDEQGNKTVKVIEITEIVDSEPEPEPDTTPPTITGVENGVTYGREVTPNIQDEHLASVTLTRNGSVVENFENGDTITENGTYVLTAIDEAGNQTVIEFVIDIDDDNNNTNTNTNTDINTNTNNNTNTDNNTSGNNIYENNSNTDSNSNNNNTNNSYGNIVGNSNGNTNRGNTSTSSSRLPYAGLGNVLMIGIVIASVVAIFTYIKYKKYE